MKMKMKMKIRPIKWVVIPEGKPTYDYQATTVEIVDEGSGEYVQVTQDSGEDNDGINICTEEFALIYAAIATAMYEIKQHEQTNE